MTAAIMTVAALLGIVAVAGARVVLGVLRDLLSQEVRAAIPRISRDIVRSASVAMPSSHRDILEEWEARLHQLGEEDRPLAMLVESINIWRDRKDSAREAAEATALTLSAHAGSLSTGSTVAVGSGAGVLGLLGTARRRAQAIGPALVRLASQARRALEFLLELFAEAASVLVVAAVSTFLIVAVFVGLMSPLASLAWLSFLWVLAYFWFTSG
jgi:predicted translin family RNA/ssDNA-binding protein